MEALVSRREFLKASAGATGSLVLAVHLPGLAAAAHSFTPNAFVTIGSDGMVTLTMPYVEMGQGTYTSIPMLVAEELEVDLSQVRTAHAPADPAYRHGLFGVQLTGASASIRAAWMPLRQAGAAARTMLVQAAAKQWGVDPASCKAVRGEVVHAGSGRKLAYGALAADAAALPVPKDIALKPAGSYTLVGKGAKRTDTPSKVNGTAKFGIDAVVPGMKVAAIAACPVFGGKLAKVDDSKALKVKGVRKVVRLDDAVAVIADHTGAARKGLAACAITWDEGSNKGFSSAAWEQKLASAGKEKGLVVHDEGGYAKVAGGAGRKVDAVYTMPFLAHATMEPMNATARVGKDGVDIWTGTQAPERLQNFVGKALGIAPASVRVHNQLLGGGFGRRLEVDVAVQAALVARQVDYPVKLIWSREEDIQHDYYRPFWRDEMAAVLDAGGMPVAFSHRFAGSSIEARYAPEWLAKGIDTDAVEMAEGPYSIPARYVEYMPVETGVPTGFWRGVGPTHNIFVVESFIDELADAAGKDPVAYRQALLGKNPRALAVLNLAAQKAGWATRKPGPGEGFGVSVGTAWGSFAAAVLECAVSKEGTVTVKRVVTAIDCGQPVHPDGVVAQAEGGQVYGLTAALYGKLTLENGRIMQSNFHDYPLMRMNEMPVMETHIVPSTESPGGMGELGTALIAPALANAVFAATGKRLRTLPLEVGPV
ncbi:molybdopterin-dependent oxidoreductase [Pseudoduganella eburnea]|uniref:Molybdopterin-dependent oxidoreductase n=1 Tax=Massilia eburnea TaxID=1776165 RepID=A0A6L6QMR4_9BURK|nr:xanthine dehydrogenase family protein molybdopterin-binding subunit [Massilia eburnea]MTW13629.1 molybdopterin-dependent oxidoreductase [Massilia eburnea]